MSRCALDAEALHEANVWLDRYQKCWTTQPGSLLLQLVDRAMTQRARRG